MESFATRIVIAAAPLGILGGWQSAAYADGAMVPGASIMQQSSTGIYLRLDGSYQNVSLPNLALGIQSITAEPATNDAGMTQSFSPNPGGYGIGGAIGYLLPTGWVSPMLGADPRIEFGANYVSVTGTQSPSAAPNGPRPTARWYR